MTTLSFDEATHTYRWDGVVVPSVTTILRILDDSALSRVSPDVLAAAAGRGTAVHKATELDDEGTLDESSVDPAIAPYLEAWRRYRADTGLEPIAVEQRVYHNQHRYAGTFDRVAMLDGQRVIVDIKSGTAWPSHGPQTAAYAYAWERMHGKKIDGRIVVYLASDGQYRADRHGNQNDWATFVAALTIYRFKEQKCK